MIADDHGTYAGRQQHRREHTPPCDECLDAAALYQFTRRRSIVVAAVDDLLKARPDLVDVRAPIPRFLAGVKENA